MGVEMNLWAISILISGVFVEQGSGKATPEDIHIHLHGLGKEAKSSHLWNKNGIQGRGESGPACTCDYNNVSGGGCRIVEPPPEGFTCVCEYYFLWSCSGTAVPCKPGQESCPANCKSVAC
eukprot:TRINITY_DN3466_c0_g1_i1.p1 TRINITY_DN3466_c0_g1~~TRINITY_DN3466_c0_g1_i1.p1  ORF type:complete len:129 (-),score=28.68 TRINITY_DN3466_c0_g1_i1:144-506(-)